MTMKVMLIQPLHASREPGPFTLGIGYIARAIKEAGCHVELLDIHALKLGRSRILNRVREYQPDIIGISAFSTQYTQVAHLCRDIKEFWTGRLIVGGGLTTFNPELVLKNTKADISVVGEGDETITDILGNLNNLDQVKGIWYRDNGTIHQNEPRAYISNLDALPYADYDIFPLDVYFKHTRLLGGYGNRVVNIVTSRGCPYNCRFCSRTMRGVRFRSIDNVADELQLLKSKYNIDGVIINDELMMVRKSRVYELCRVMKDLQLKWGCQGRVNIVDVDVLKAMKDSGCLFVGYGIESGSQQILDAMDKKTTVEQNEHAIRETLKVGIIPIIQMMIGYPGETRETVMETVGLMDRVHCSLPLPDSTGPSLSLTIPLPGSPLYEEVKKQGRVADEVAYLGKIATGFYHSGRVVMNLTDMSDRELLGLKAWAERQIYLNFRNYVLKRPWLFIRFLFGRFRKRLQPIVG
jgi:radical SAM superfamily enzyme YgiQ (UPF0313 family)